ncbi:interleukin 15, like isoform X2 [Lepisosteus oculatus]|uniref:interleukin 15, like isoform X2 n=1 Tax=Lepisosteus oculatus TaxID=7918 RepID=UPI00371F76CA
MRWRMATPGSTLLRTLCCLVAMTPWAGGQRALCSREAVADLQSLQSNISGNRDNCTLYTANVSDYKECPNSTLSCFIEELGVLILEFGHTRTNVSSKLLRRLHRLNTKKDQKADCPQCEAHEEQPPWEFLTALLSVLQSINDSC